MPVGSLAYYISGHGYGHARRSAEVIRAVAAKSPGIIIHVRTSAPEMIFEGIPGVRYEHLEIDSGAVERDLLTIDPELTLRKAQSIIENAAAIVESEAEFLKRAGVGMIAADVPFLAGDIAEAAGIPCYAVSNFTWDWIYEPFVEHLPQYTPLLESIRASYRKMTGVIRLPFPQPTNIFRKTLDAPLVAWRGIRNRADVLRKLKIDADDPRPKIVLGMRGAADPSLLEKAASDAPDMLFLSPPKDLEFIEALAVCDAAVTKLGYGIVADCIAAQTALLWPRRSGFREDEITGTEAAKYTRMREIPVADFLNGRWAAHLRLLLAQPKPTRRMDVGGAEFCAEALLGAMVSN
jgi:hypothetical protein